MAQFFLGREKRKPEKSLSRLFGEAVIQQGIGVLGAVAIDKLVTEPGEERALAQWKTKQAPEVLKEIGTSYSNGWKAVASGHAAELEAMDLLQSESQTVRNFPKKNQAKASAKYQRATLLRKEMAVYTKKGRKAWTADDHGIYRGLKEELDGINAWINENVTPGKAKMTRLQFKYSGLDPANRKRVEEAIEDYRRMSYATAQGHFFQTKALYEWAVKSGISVNLGNEERKAMFSQISKFLKQHNLKAQNNKKLSEIVASQAGKTDDAIVPAPQKLDEIIAYAKQGKGGIAAKHSKLLSLKKGRDGKSRIIVSGNADKIFRLIRKGEFQLGRGMEGAAVTRLQEQIVEASASRWLDEDDITGVYDEKTYAAVLKVKKGSVFGVIDAEFVDVLDRRVSSMKNAKLLGGFEEAFTLPNWLSEDPGKQPIEPIESRLRPDAPTSIPSREDVASSVLRPAVKIDTSLFDEEPEAATDFAYSPRPLPTPPQRGLRRLERPGEWEEEHFPASALEEPIEWEPEVEDLDVSEIERLPLHEQQRYLKAAARRARPLEIGGEPLLLASAGDAPRVVPPKLDEESFAEAQKREENVVKRKKHHGLSATEALALRAGGTRKDTEEGVEYTLTEAYSDAESSYVSAMKQSGISDTMVASAINRYDADYKEKVARQKSYFDERKQLLKDFSGSVQNLAGVNLDHLKLVFDAHKQNANDPVGLMVFENLIVDQGKAKGAADFLCFIMQQSSSKVQNKFLSAISNIKTPEEIAELKKVMGQAAEEKGAWTSALAADYALYSPEALEYLITEDEFGHFDLLRQGNPHIYAKVVGGVDDEDTRQALSMIMGKLPERHLYSVNGLRRMANNAIGHAAAVSVAQRAMQKSPAIAQALADDFNTTAKEIKGHFRTSLKSLDNIFRERPKPPSINTRLGEVVRAFSHGIASTEEGRKLLKAVRIAKEIAERKVYSYVDAEGTRRTEAVNIQYDTLAPLFDFTDPALSLYANLSEDMMTDDPKKKGKLFDAAHKRGKKYIQELKRKIENILLGNQGAVVRALGPAIGTFQ